MVGIGLTFSQDKATGEYVVKRVVPGGSAHKSGKIKAGDRFFQVTLFESSQDLNSTLRNQACVVRWTV